MYRINKTLNYSISNLSSSSSTSKLVKRKSNFFNFTNRFSSLLRWKIQHSHHRTTFSPVWVHKLSIKSPQRYYAKISTHVYKILSKFALLKSKFLFTNNPRIFSPIWIFQKLLCSTQFLWIPKNPILPQVTFIIYYHNCSPWCVRSIRVS